MSAAAEMPKYECHKKVWALRIAGITYLQNKDTYCNGATITPAEEGYAPFDVSLEYVQKHNPQVGGYYVVYQDGYKSYSPAQAFESGYTRI